MIKIEFKCTCLKEPAKFFVRERRGEAEDIVDWMKQVVEPALGVAHRELSPLCMATKTEYLKIPIAGDDQPLGMSSKEQKSNYKL